MPAQSCDHRIKTSLYVEDNVNVLRGSVSADTFYGGLFSLSAAGENGSGTTNTLSGQQELTLSAVSGVSACLNDNTFQLSLNVNSDQFCFDSGQLELQGTGAFDCLEVGGGYGDVVDGGLTIDSCGNLSADGLIEGDEYYKDGDLLLSPTLIRCSNSTIDADGWYRIACTSNQNGRSDFNTVIYSVGGNTAPGVTDLRISKDAGDFATLNLTHHGGNLGNTLSARLVDDGSDNMYLDVYLSTSNNPASPELFCVDIIKDRNIGATIDYVDFTPIASLGGSETEYTSIKTQSTIKSYSTSDCGNLFDVHKNCVQAYKPLRLPDGDLSGPGLSFGDDTNSGIRRITSDELSFVNGGVDTMTLDSSNCVGIGTTTPNEKLTVAGNISASGELFGTNPGLDCVGDITGVCAGNGLTGGGTSGEVTVDVEASCLTNWNGVYTTVNTNSGSWGTGACVDGTLNYISKFIDTDAVGDSLLYDDGSNIGLGTTTPNACLDVRGDVIFNEDALDKDFRVESLSSAPSGVADLAYTLFVDASQGRVGIGTPSPSFGLEVDGTAYISGNFSVGGTKSFLIDHPTEEGKYLKYASLEGPENGVYVRGTSMSDYIELPGYWEGLVDEDSITVSLTPRGASANLYLLYISDNKVYVGRDKNVVYDYHVYATRKDLDPLVVEGVKDY